MSEKKSCCQLTAIEKTSDTDEKTSCCQLATIAEKTPEPDLVEIDLEDPDETCEICEKKEVESSDKKTISQRFNDFLPLILIFLYISTASVFINFDTDWEFQGDNFMIVFMGLFYIVFSFFKLLNLKGFVMSFKKYDFISMYIPYYGYLYPFMEIALSFLLLYKYELVIINFIILFLFLENIISVFYALYKKKDIMCACLGTMLNLPLTKVTIIEDFIMIVMTSVWLIKNY